MKIEFLGYVLLSMVIQYITRFSQEYILFKLLVINLLFRLIKVGGSCSPVIYFKWCSRALPLTRDRLLPHQIFIFFKAFGEPSSLIINPK